MLCRDWQAAVCFRACVISQLAGLLERAELSFAWRPVAANAAVRPRNHYYYIRLILVCALLALLLILLLILDIDIDTIELVYLVFLSHC